MIVALDPSETRPAGKAPSLPMNGAPVVVPGLPDDAVRDPAQPAAAQVEPTPRPRRAGMRRTRTVMIGVVSLGALAAFGAGAMTVMGNLAAPQRPRILAAGTSNASDWPALKDGLPVLVTGTAAAPAGAIPQPAQAALPLAPVSPPPAPPARAMAAATATEPAATASATVASTDITAPTVRTAVAAPVSLPAIEIVAPREPEREASTMAPPAKPAATVVPRAAETVQARSAPSNYAALPPEPAAEAKAAFKSVPRTDAGVAIKPEIKPAPKSAAQPAAKAAAERATAKEATKVATRTPDRIPDRTAAKTAARAPTPTPDKPARVQSVVAEAVPPQAERDAGSETTEVFGLKVPSLAPAGRKIRESVEALGDAVKSLPDRF